jgi:hypothetical protein
MIESPQLKNENSNLNFLIEQMWLDPHYQALQKRVQMLHNSLIWDIAQKNQ